jgi:uncharacterized protein YigA (DUF484 family)
VTDGRRATDHPQVLERVAVLEHRAEAGERELERVRGRIHELMAERSAVAKLAGELARIVADFEAIAAAAVTRALAERDELERARGVFRRGGVALGLQAAALVFAGAGTTAAIIFGLHGG